MLTRMSLKSILVFGALIFVAPTVMAGFATYSKVWPNDANSVDENAVEPTEQKIDLSHKEAMKIKKETGEDVSRVSDYRRIYLKFGLNASVTEVRHITNWSYPPLANAAANVDTVQNNDVNWEAGIGTKYFEHVRFELEYFKHRLLNYNPSPVVVGNSASLTSTVDNQALLIEMYWDFDNIVYFKPYVGALTGVVWNKTRSTLVGGGVGNGNAENENHYGLAWGFSIGARMPFWSNWYGYFGYRYTAQSKVYWEDNTSVLQMQGRYVFSGFSLGVNYII